jgi:hypothetical protein
MQRRSSSNIGWRVPKKTLNPWQAEKDVLLSAIRNNKPHNEARRDALGRAGMRCQVYTLTPAAL